MSEIIRQISTKLVELINWLNVYIIAMCKHYINLFPSSCEPGFNNIILLEKLLFGTGKDLR